MIWIKHPKESTESNEGGKLRTQAWEITYLSRQGESKQDLEDKEVEEILSGLVWKHQGRPIFQNGVVNCVKGWRAVKQGHWGEWEMWFSGSVTWDSSIPHQSARFKPQLLCTCDPTYI